MCSPDLSHEGRVAAHCEQTAFWLSAFRGLTQRSCSPPGPAHVQWLAGSNEGLAISVHLKDSSSGSRIPCVLLWDPLRASGAPHLLPHSIPDLLPFLSQMLIPTGFLNKHSKLHFRICFLGNPIHNSWSEKTAGAGPVCSYKKIMDGWSRGWEKFLQSKTTIHCPVSKPESAFSLGTP